MAKVTLAQIVGDWVAELGTPLFFDGTRINHPCECGTGHWTYARLDGNKILLPHTKCKCKNCREMSVDMANPNAFVVLGRALKIRMKHKSVIFAEDIWDADELMHAVRHKPDGGRLNLCGNIDGANIDAAKFDIEVKGGAVITNSQFVNIVKPITISGAVSFIGNGFYASKDQPPTAPVWDWGNTFYAGF